MLPDLASITKSPLMPWLGLKVHTLAGAEGEPLTIWRPRELLKYVSSSDKRVSLLPFALTLSVTPDDLATIATCFKLVTIHQKSMHRISMRFPPRSLPKRNRQALVIIS